MNNLQDIEFKPIVLIPCYRHVQFLDDLLTKLSAFEVPIMIIDDGNSSEDNQKLVQYTDKYNNVSLVVNPKNGGKGDAMKLGFNESLKLNYTHAVQIDADGQQDCSELLKILELAKNNVQELIVGQPVYSNVPLGRFISRYITHFWVAVELGVFKVVDSMCGFRVYPLKITCEIMNHRNVGKRMAFDTEILVRLYWAGVNFKFFNVQVLYPENGYSNFKPFSDNVLISLMHTKLCVEKILHYFSIRKRKYI